jgi:hypothetical protein
LFAYVNFVFALIAAALWYLFPQLMAWPLLLSVVPWLLRLAHEGGWQWRTPFDWPLLLFLISGMVGVWAAYDREMAWAKFWTIVAGVILFYALAAFSLPGAPDDPQRGGIPTAWFLAFAGAGVSLYFLTTHDWDDFPTKYTTLSAIGRSLQGPLPELPGHRLNPNVAGGILAVMIPFSAAVSGQGGRARNWPALILGLTLFCITLLGLLLSSSRGAWLAVLGAVALAILWWLVGLGNRKQPGQRRQLFMGMLLLGAIIVLFALILWPEIPQKLIGSLPLLVGGTNRLDLLRNSLILVQEYPFIGAGLGAYMMLYSTYAYLTHVGFIIHSHNIYLDVLIEQGFVALLALLWMWGVFATALWRESFDGRIRPYLGAATLSLVTILLHGLVEDALYGSRAVMLLFLPLAFTLPYPQRKEKVVSRLRWLVQGLVLGLLVVTAAVWARPLRSAAISNLASIRQSQAELSRYQWPEWPIQDAIRRETDLSSAIAGYEKALTLNPLNAAANRRLGQLELSLGEYEDALGHLELAYKSTPWDHASRLLLGEALLVNGRVDEGSALWASINNSQAQLQARAFWYEYLADEKRLAQIRAGLERR